MIVQCTPSKNYISAIGMETSQTASLYTNDLPCAQRNRNDVSHESICKLRSNNLRAKGHFLSALRRERNA